MTDQHKAENLIRRTDRLQVFVHTFRGQWNSVIETAAYRVLETHWSRPRAIWRYFCYALREWRNSLWVRFMFERRLWWHRYVRGLEREAAIEKVCEILEEKFVPIGEKKKLQG
jgi:hypothetical protein